MARKANTTSETSIEENKETNTMETQAATAIGNGSFAFTLDTSWTPPANAKKGGGGGKIKYDWSVFAVVGMSAPIPDIDPAVIRKSINKFLAKQEAEALVTFKAANGGSEEGFKEQWQPWEFNVYSLGKSVTKGEDGKDVTAHKGARVLRSK